MNKNLIFGIIVLICFGVSALVLVRGFSKSDTPAAVVPPEITTGLLPHGSSFDLGSLEKFSTQADAVFVIPQVLPQDAGLLPQDAFRPTISPTAGIAIPQGQEQ